MSIFATILEGASKTKLIWGIIILILFLFVVLGVLGMLINRLMRWQGKTIDKLMYKVTITRVIQNKRHFQKIAFIKSNRYFFKQAWIPFILMLSAFLFWLIFSLITGQWGFDYLTNFGDIGSDEVSRSGGTSISTLMYLWDFGKIWIPQDIGVLVQWPPVLNAPHFSADAWPSYVLFILLVPSLSWFLVLVQSYIARIIRIFRLSHSIYEKNLDKFKFDDNLTNMKNIDLENTTPEK